MRYRHSFMKTLLIFCLVAWIGAVSTPSAQPERLRVLILSGQNNHDWKTTTTELKNILEASGRFSCDATENPAECTTQMLAEYDVVVSNWTNFPSQERSWGPQAEAAIMDFVRGGKGFVVFHAGSSQFYDWPDFFTLTGSRWGKATGHGPAHTFVVKIADTRHPVTAGLEDFWITDELWHRAEKHPGIHALATAFSALDKGGSGEAEVVALWTQFGKGRGFNLVLGHDVASMRNAGWRTLMMRGTEWAATGKVTIAPQEDWPVTPAEAEIAAIDQDALFQAVANYKDGQNRQDLLQAAKLVHLVANDSPQKPVVVAHLVAVLDGGSGATREGRQFCCRQLSLIGSANEVPALAALREDHALAEEARAALERIPGPEAAAALREAMDGASGHNLVGLINALGERHDELSVQAIALHLKDQDAATRDSAIDALGKIGTEAAARALQKMDNSQDVATHARRAQALVICADHLAASGRRDMAMGIYRTLSEVGHPEMVRLAAIAGLIDGAGDSQPLSPDRGELILQNLNSGDEVLARAGLAALGKYPDMPPTETVVRLLPTLDSPAQIRLIQALVNRGDKTATSALLELAAKSPVEELTAGALAAVGRLGGADCIQALVNLSHEGTPAGQETARRALTDLRGAEVDGAILKSLKASSPDIQCQLIEVLTGRNAKSALPALIELSGDDDRALADAAIKAIGILGSIEDVPTLITLMESNDNEKGLDSLEAALLAIAQRYPADRVINHISAPLTSARVPVQNALTRVLGRMGGPEALAIVVPRAALADGQIHATAVRVLADWPDATPVADLLSIAGDENDPSLRTIALRGFAKQVAMAENMPDDQRIQLIEKGLGLSHRNEEKKALLGQLGKINTPEALPVIVGYLDQPEVRAEASLAVLQLADVIWMADRTGFEAALQKVADSSDDPALRERAQTALERIQTSTRPNLAPMAKATSPDGLEKDGQASGDQAAIDGDLATFWDEQDNEKLYRLVLTFPFLVEIEAVRITGYVNELYAPKDFEILCDGKVVKMIQDAAYTDNLLTVGVPRTRCRTLELKITGSHGPSPAIRELEVYGPDESAQAPDAP